MKNFDGVMATTKDATASKMSAVAKGYYKDNAIAFFVSEPTERRPPLINRGYYSRVTAIRSIICDFFEGVDLGSSFAEVQIVNIGAGLDPVFYWLTEELESTHYENVCTSSLRYFELDFPEILRAKSQIVDQTVLLQRTVRRYNEAPESNLINEEGVISSKLWRMVPCDLRYIDQLDVSMQKAGLRKDVPTLFLCECVLAYLEVTEADRLVQWLATYVEKAPSCFVDYEPFNPNDRFGRMMVENLKARDCPLLSIHAYPTLDDLARRFENLGYQNVSIMDMNTIYRECLDEIDLLRIEHLELFDEMEEWRLIQGHYYIAVCLRMAQGKNSFGTLSNLSGYWPTRASPEARQNMPRFTTKECLKATHFQILSETASRLMAIKNASPKKLRGTYLRSSVAIGADLNHGLMNVDLAVPSPPPTSRADTNDERAAMGENECGNFQNLRSGRHRALARVGEEPLLKSGSLKDSCSAPLLLKVSPAPLMASEETNTLSTFSGQDQDLLPAFASVKDVLHSCAPR